MKCFNGVLMSPKALRGGGSHRKHLDKITDIITSLFYCSVLPFLLGAGMRGGERNELKELKAVGHY